MARKRILPGWCGVFLVVLLSACELPPRAERGEYNVGIGGMYIGRAHCRPDERAPLLWCEVRFRGETLIRGLYYPFEDGDGSPQIAVAISLGIKPYSPELRLLLPDSTRQRVVDGTRLEPLDEDGKQQMAAFLCDFLERFGGLSAQCAPDDTFVLPSIAVSAAGGEDDCRVYATMGDQLLSIHLDSNCDAEAWRVTYDTLSSNFANAERWYIEQMIGR